MQPSHCISLALLFLCTGLQACMPANSDSALDRSWIMLTAAIAGKSPENFSGLSFWYKADALTANHNDPISTWSDSSGMANDAVAASAPENPLYQTNAINGHPALLFDGSNDALVGVDIDYNTITIFAVSLYTKTVTDGSFHVGPVVSNSNASPNVATVLYYQWQNNATAFAFGSSSNGTSIALTAFGYTTPQWRLSTAIADGTSTLLYDSGNLKFTNTSDPGNQYNTATSFYVGRSINSTATQFFQGYIAEIIMYNRSLSEFERAQVECHLSLKYSLYVSHICY